MEIKSDRVDLTENRDFGPTRRNTANLITGERTIDVSDLINEFTINRLIEEGNFTEYNPSDLFPTGTVDILRKTKQEMEFMGYGEFKRCDRCGKKLYPWEVCGICETCFDEVEAQVLHRLPWENQSSEDNNILL